MATFESVASDSNPMNKPSGLAVDDTMVAIITVGFGNASSPSAPSGWTLLTSITNTSNDYAELHVFVKRAVSADVSASEFDFGTGQGVIYRVSGSVYSTSNIQYAIVEGSGNSLDDLTPPVSGCLLLFGCVNANNAGASDSLTSVTLTGDTNPTWTIDRNAPAAGHSDGMAHATYNSTSTITDVTGDLSATDDNLRVLVILRPLVNDSVSAEVQVISVGVQDPSITGSASVSAGSVQDVVSSVIDPTVSTGAMDYQNATKTTETFTPTTKNTETFTTTTKNTETWTGTTKN
jgi:hypothetical protein